jgi:Zn-dependent protease/CBS domain-containing protein
MAMAQSSEALTFPATQKTGLGMPGGSIRLLRIAGIDIGIHVSWFVIFALVTWSLAEFLFPVAVPGLRQSTYWIVGAISALLLFVSVLIHELAHSLVARARGLEPRSITLFIFGGVSSLGGEAKKPSTEFLVAVVGPLSSFAIAFIVYAIGYVLQPGDLVAAVFSYLIFINVVLGFFNLIPGFPLDGGRVFRSIVWNVTGNFRRATEIAVAVSKFFAYGFMLIGLFRLLNGDLIGGIWTAAIGWFLDNAASMSLAQVVFEQRIGKTRVADVFTRDTTAASAELTVDRLIEDFMLARNRRAVPVVQDGRVLGVVTLGDVRGVPPERRPFTRVGDLVRDQQTVAVRPEDNLRAAVEALNSGEFEVLPVVENGQLVGVLSRADVMRQIELREALDVGDRTGRAGGQEVPAPARAS